MVDSARFDAGAVALRPQTLALQALLDTAGAAQHATASTPGPDFDCRCRRCRRCWRR